MNAWLFKTRQVKEWFLDLFFPKDCFGCHQEGTYLCPSCLQQIEFNQKFRCVFCHQETDASGICPACRNNDVFLDGVWVATNYNDPKIQGLIAGLKYKYIVDLGFILGNFLATYLAQQDLLLTYGLRADTCSLVPVPLHARRLLVRGFNQSSLLAEQVAKRYHLSIQDLLKRIVNTQSQVHLKRTERQKNVENAFALNPLSVLSSATKIILIDDVLTTSSTLNQCAKILKQAGYQSVYALVIAQRED